jgi:hypothetical protein
MNANQDLIGKTITGIVATRNAQNGMKEIWMMQFSDGTHVEFVSPRARRELKRNTRRRKAVAASAVDELQMALNVA